MHQQQRGALVRANAFGDFIKNFFNFEKDNWGPKSTRIWRQQSYEYPGSQQDEDDDAPSTSGGSPGAVGPAAPAPSASGSAPASPSPRPLSDEQMLSQLQARINSLPPSSSKGAAGRGAAAAADDGDVDDAYARPAAERSFSDVSEQEFAAALNKRIGQIAASTASYDSELTEEEMRAPLTAQELRELVYAKYGKTYDLSFVRRDIPGKTFVCLNVMWSHLEQRSFKMTEEQYMDKLDGIAYLIAALGQTDKVRAFLKEPAKSQKGLPPRPVVGTAISIRFDLEQSVIDEWFGKGYQ